MRTSRYFKWLTDLVGGPGQNYSIVLNAMNSIPFVSLVDYDENRAEAGLYLRERYLMEDMRRAYPGHGDATVLEVLVALAEQTASEAVSLEDQPDGLYWFWEFVRNLDLDGFTDDCEDEDYNRDIRSILLKFVNRMYEEDGYGGIFPLRSAREDQRKVELWYQMMAYLSEMM